MQKDILFKEVQMFANVHTQLFFKIATGVMIAICALSFFVKNIETKQLREGLLLGVLFTALISYVLTKIKLITWVCIDGIYVHYPPFQSSVSHFEWKNIKSIYLRTYSPLREYGGWGVRFGPKGTAYNVSGTSGLQLVFNDDSKLLIGTNNPEQLAFVLNRIGKLDILEE